MNVENGIEWEEIVFGDLFDFEKKSKIKAGEGLDKGKFKFFTSSPIQNKFYNEYLFEKESLIFGTGGKPSIHYCNEKFSTSTDCFVTYTKNNNVLPKYVFYYLLSNFHIIENGFHGAGLKHLSKRYLQNIAIKFPKDIKIQAKFIEKFDKIDALKFLRKESIELSDLYLRSLFEEMFFNQNFQEYELKEFTSLISSGSTPRGGRDNYMAEGEILFIRSQNVLMNKFSNHDSLYIPIDIHNNMKRTWLKNKDVLLNITGASIGRTVVYEGLNDKANLNQHVCIIRLKDFNDLNPYYLNYYLSSSYIQNHIKKINAGATREALNFTQIGKFKILVPPIELQNQFAEIVQQVEIIKKYQNQSKEELDNLFNNLMQKAFKGELIC